MIVGFAGQLAWTVENMYLNVFVYDTLSTDPAVTSCPQSRTSSARES